MGGSIGLDVGGILFVATVAHQWVPFEVNIVEWPYVLVGLFR